MYICQTDQGDITINTKVRDMISVSFNHTCFVKFIMTEYVLHIIKMAKWYLRKVWEDVTSRLAKECNNSIQTGRVA